jgi:hypothetical protein
MYYLVVVHLLPPSPPLTERHYHHLLLLCTYTFFVRESGGRSTIGCLLSFIVRRSRRESSGSGQLVCLSVHTVCIIRCSRMYHNHRYNNSHSRVTSESRDARTFSYFKTR